MSIIRRLILHILGTQSQKIHSDFGGIIVRATKNLEKADEPIGKLLVNWFVSLPWAYFEALFINDESWNGSLLAALDNAQVNNGKDCALISQAFCLWHLEQIIRNDEKYNYYSMKEIEEWIGNQTGNGALITEKLKKFRKVLQDLPPDDWYFVYINEILDVLYTDYEKTSSIIDGMRLDLRLRTALEIYSTEMIVAAKETLSITKPS